MSTDHRPTSTHLDRRVRVPCCAWPSQASRQRHVAPHWSSVATHGATTVSLRERRIRCGRCFAALAPGLQEFV